MYTDLSSKLQEQINKLKNEENEWQTKKSTIQSKISNLEEEEKQWHDLKDVLLSRLKILRSAANANPSERQIILSKLSSQPSIELLSPDKSSDQLNTPKQDSKIEFNDSDENNIGSLKNDRSSPSFASPAMFRKKLGKELKRRKSGNSPKVGSPKSSDQHADGNGYTIKWSLSQHLDCVRCVAFHPTLPYIATGSDDGSIRITNLDPPKKTKTRNTTQLVSLRGHSSAVLSLASYHNYLISGDVDGQVCVWNFLEMKSLMNELYDRIDHHINYFNDDHQDAVWSIATHENSPYFVTASADKTIRIHNIETQKSTSISIPDGPTVASFNSDGTIFVVGSLSGHIKKFENKQESGSFDLQSYIISICPSTSKNEMFIASEDKNIRLFDILSGAVLKQFVPHELYTSAMALNSDGQYLVTTSPDKTIRIWNSSNFDLVSVDSHHREKYGEAGLCMAATQSTSSYDYFASGGADGVVRVFIRSK